MPIKRRAIWTPENDNRLKAMAASGVSVLKAAVVFKCTVKAIRLKARKLGTPFPSIQEVRKKLASEPDSSGRFR